MPIDRVIVLALAASISLYAVVRGGPPERWCAAIIMAGILVDQLFPLLFDARDFEHFSSSRLVIDLHEFAGFVAVALMANRVWPLWMAAAQLVAITGSIAALIIPHGVNYAYWALTQLPIIVQLVAMGLGTFAHDRRVAQLGRYNCWSPGCAGR